MTVANGIAGRLIATVALLAVMTPWSGALATPRARSSAPIDLPASGDADPTLAYAHAVRPIPAPCFDAGALLFLQRDPSGYEDSVNLYAGFKHDPVNLRDPTGRSSEAEIAACTKELHLSRSECIDRTNSTLGQPVAHSRPRGETCFFGECTPHLTKAEADELFVRQLVATSQAMGCALDMPGCFAALAAVAAARAMGVEDPAVLEAIAWVSGLAGSAGGAKLLSPPKVPRHQEVVNDIHDALGRGTIAHRNRTTTLNIHKSGRKSLTGSTKPNPAQRAVAIEKGITDIPPHGRDLALDGPAGRHGEQRGIAYGDCVGDPVVCQVSSSGASHGGRACPECAIEQQKRQIENPTGEQQNDP